MPSLNFKNGNLPLVGRGKTRPLWYCHSKHAPAA